MTTTWQRGYCSECKSAVMVTGSDDPKLDYNWRCSNAFCQHSVDGTDTSDMEHPTWVYDPEDLRFAYGSLVGANIEHETQHREQLEKIQGKCAHEETHIMYYSWRIGSMHPMRFCKICGKMLGEPTPEELKKFKADELQANREGWAKNYPGIPYPFENGPVASVSTSIELADGENGWHTLANVSALPLAERKIVINSRHGGFGLSEKAWEILRTAGVETDNCREIERDDPRLVEVVEQLGKESWDTCARLKVISIPADVDWMLCESNGSEWIAEKHRTWD